MRPLLVARTSSAGSTAGSATMQVPTLAASAEATAARGHPNLAGVECSGWFGDEPGLVLGAHDEPAHRGPERTEPYPLRPIQGDLDQPGRALRRSLGRGPG